MPNTLTKFISIEESISNAVNRAWIGQARDIRNRILAALKDGNENKALDVMDEIDFTAAVKKASGKVTPNHPPEDSPAGFDLADGLAQQEILIS